MSETAVVAVAAALLARPVGIGIGKEWKEGRKMEAGEGGRGKREEGRAGGGKRAWTTTGRQGVQAAHVDKVQLQKQKSGGDGEKQNGGD